MIADIEGDYGDLLKSADMPASLPILAVRNLVLFPGVVSPILIGRESSMSLVKRAEKNNTIIGIVCQRDPETDEPGKNDLYEYGVYARVVKILTLPNGNITAIIQGFGRLRLTEITRKKPYLYGKAEPAMEIVPDKDDSEFSAAMDDLRQMTNEYIKLNDDIPEEASFAIKNVSNNVMALNFICSNMLFSIKDKMDLLCKDSIKDRLFGTMRIINRELSLLSLKQDIRNKTRDDIDEQQRNYFLQQQIKNLQAEISNGESSPEKLELMEKAEKKKWPEEVAKTFEKECDKLDQLNPQSPDYNVQLTYLQTMVALPWGEYTQDDMDLGRAQKVLDKDHYGMEKVKERILEYIAVLNLRGDLKSPILCLYGPPGVGKTSLGKSIAAAMSRKYVRMSLGGLHDEAEIRGHRRTYIGAMPGRIIKNIQKAGSSNPVFVLDEIDKVTQNTVNGDPASALLEVLDPEQNSAFHDNYLDLDYDLSKVLFIATANDLNTIPRPLLDRMELIEVSGYITEEKIEIAKRHLIPKEKDNTGLGNEKKLAFTKAAIEKIIEQYTRESGVRQLEKQINKALRKLALKKAQSQELPYTKITPTEIEDLLGKPPFYRDIYQGNDYAGVVTGLAWTSVTDRQPGRRDEGVGDTGARICEGARRRTEHRLPHLRQLEHPHPRAGGSNAKRRAVGRNNHRHLHRLRAHPAQGAQEHGHDGRDNPQRESAARGRHQGKDSCGQARGHNGHCDVPRQQERHRRDSRDLHQGHQLPLRRECTGRVELRPDRRACGPSAEV